MRSLGGMVLLGGIGVGLFVYLPAPVDRQTSLDNAQRFAATRAAESAPAPGPAAPAKLRTFAPSISLAEIAQRSAPPVTRPAPGGWQTTTSALLGADSRTLEPTSPESRYKLITDIQQQLKRVGCYYGRIDGSWGGASKDAVQSFLQRVNATLPSENPDYVLLTLLQSQSAKVCGECPADQVLSTGGRCVARAVVAYGQQAPSATAPKEVLPWQGTGTATRTAAAKPLFTPLPTSVVSTEPLPGRMAIGGPKALPPVNTVYAPPASTASGSTAPAVATAAVSPQASPVAAPSEPRPAKSYKRSRRVEGPGTPRYNLMLSLGGVY